MNTSASVSPQLRSFSTVFGQLSTCTTTLLFCAAVTCSVSAQISLPPAGRINTIAGNVSGGDLNDGGPATTAMLSEPYGVAVDANGNLYIADEMNNRIRLVNASTGVISTVAGNGQDDYSGDSGPATNASLSGPTGVAVDAIGNLYIADNGNSVIRLVTASTGIITTIAGNGSWGYSGDGGPATAAQMINPNAVAIDASGNLYIADTYNNVIRLVSGETGIITTVAGNGSCGPGRGTGNCFSSGTYGGDGGPATSAQLFWPNGIALDSNNNLYIADTYNNVVRMVSSSTGIITTVAGNGSNAGNPFAGGYTGDGGPATSAGMSGPFGVVIDGAGHLYIADCFNNVVRMVSPNGVIGTVAGNGDANFGGDGGPAIAASMYDPTSVSLDTNGNLYIVDTWNGVIRAVGSPSSQVQTIEDHGVVTLTINGQVAASTAYGAGATPLTIMAGLSQGVVAGAPVTLTARGGSLSITAVATGPNTNYSYSIQNSQYDSTDFTTPSFPATTISGTLSGGAPAGGPTQRPVYLYLGSYDSTGNVSGYTDSVMGSWTFGYDALNRLSSTQNLSATATSGQYLGDFGCWSYDDFGNRLSQAMSVSPCSGTPGFTSWATYSANNQLVTTNSMPGGGVSYDAAGDVTNDGVNTSLYDAEGRVCAVRSALGGSITGYLYDADGTRIAKGNISQWSCDPSANGFHVTTDYVLGLGGEQVTEMQGGVWQHTNVFAGGKLLATYDQQGLHFYLNDPLGTRRAQTDYAGNLEQTCASLPFGDQLSCSGSITSPTEHHFTGKERDTESGLDYFGARYYASNMGRWMSPDWVAKAEPVPYSKLDNPQTLNLYQYMRNNPLSGADPDGHCDWCQKLLNGVKGDGFQTNAQLADQRTLQSLNNPTVTTTETYKPVSSEPNQLVTLGSDVAAGVAAATDSTKLGGVAVGVSSLNDPSPQNLSMNALSLVPIPEVGQAVAAITLVMDVGKVAGDFVKDVILTPMLNSLPPQNINDGSGHMFPNPALQDPTDPRP